MEVIAEGVETDLQLNAMIAAQAPLVQGYLLAKPMDPDDLTRWLTEEPRALTTEPYGVPGPRDTPTDVPESEKS
nr:hypothetical protein GCM10025732_53040 [Glycomyces mayteni]